MVKRTLIDRRKVIKPLEQSAQYLIGEPRIKGYATGIIRAAKAVSGTNFKNLAPIKENNKGAVKKKEIS